MRSWTPSVIADAFAGGFVNVFVNGLADVFTDVFADVFAGADGTHARGAGVLLCSCSICRMA